jgi:tetratricopeptide (TPR) repeat protein
MAVDRAPSSSESVTAAAVRRLYTPAMLAELVGVPVSAIRRWHRQGVLQATRCVHKLPYFDFKEAAIARQLAALVHAGCSPRVIDRRLAELEKVMPSVERPLADPALVVEGRRLFLRRGDELAEPGGQLLLDFEPRENEHDEHESPQVLSMVSSANKRLQSARQTGLGGVNEGGLLEQLQQEALDWEDEGDLNRAAETYRTLLMAAGPRAEIHFALADVLYRAGDLAAARERYYAALELDEEYVEARASLGCVLAETGELELAAATFEGALEYHPDFADVHFHLANALERLGRHEESHAHFGVFLELAPESPWAESARDRLAAAGIAAPCG